MAHPIRCKSLDNIPLPLESVRNLHPTLLHHPSPTPSSFKDSKVNSTKLIGLTQRYKGTKSHIHSRNLIRQIQVLEFRAFPFLLFLFSACVLVLSTPPILPVQPVPSGHPFARLPSKFILSHYFPFFIPCLFP